MRRITFEEFQRRIQIRFPKESFTLIQYTSIGQSAIIKCNKCGQSIEVSKANNFLAPNKVYGCKNCHGLWKQREEKIQLLLKYYDILDTFVYNTHTHYHVRCKQCGHERTASLDNFMRHLACGCETSVYRRRTADEFIKEVNSYHNNEYELVSEYKNQKEKILLKHKPCGFIWKVRPGDVIHGRSRCPKCSRVMSNGERLIKRLLDDTKIDYYQEYKLENSKQRFDFYLEFGENKIAIEYNGE